MMRRQPEREVRQEATPAICVLSSEGIVVGWSRAAEELTGYSADEIMGRPGTDLRMERGNARRVWTWAGGSGDENYQTGILDLRHRDGTQILVHAESARIVTPDGSPAWVVSVIPAGAGDTGLSVLEPLLTRAPVVMAVWDSDLRSVWHNEAAQEQREVFPFFEIGRLLPEDDQAVDAPVPADLIRTVLRDGAPIVDREARWVSADGSEERTYSTFLFRVQGVDSRSLGVCLMAVDITHSRARERLALLREASVKIGTTLDVTKTAQEMADLTVPGFADYITIDLTEAVFPGPEPLQRLGAEEERIPVFRRAGLASIHPQIPEALWGKGSPVYVPPSSPFTEVLRTGRSHLEAELDTSTGTWLDNDPERVRVIQETEMHTLMIVPLRARGHLLGIAVFVRTDNKVPFGDDDLVLAEEIAARAALSLDNARQYTREHTAALALQRQLLPRRLSGGDAVELASRYLPSDTHEGVGGDWYDSILLPGSRVALIVGDVTGHGVNAAASMGRLRTAMRTLAFMDLPPAELLSRLDEVYATQMEEENGLLESPIAATCLYALYDPATRLCSMASAGHLPPAVVLPDGEVSFPTLPAGTPIGMGLGAHESFELELDEGTLMVLYTDGLIERRGSDLDAGMQRLVAALNPAMVSLEALGSSVIESLVTGTMEDDVTLLLARTRRS